jgi:hypothetical protein
MRLQRFFHLDRTRLANVEQAIEVFEHVLKLLFTAAGSSPRTLPRICLARVLSVGLRSLGSIAGLKGRTTTLAGSGRRYKVCRFKSKSWDKGSLIA